MIQNNLDPEVAENPAELVVYGGIGRAARNWECFDAILATLKRLGDDETLLVQSGKPVARASHPRRRAARAHRQLEPRAAMGDVGALQRARPQGAHDVRPDDRRLVDLHRLAGHRAGHVRDVRRGACASTYGGARPRAKWILTAGLGGMGGAQPLAATMAGCVDARDRVPPVAHRHAPSHRYLDRQAASLDDALALRARGEGADLDRPPRQRGRDPARDRRGAACGPTSSPTRPRRTTS